jgi:hypothetical protein
MTTKTHFTALEAQRIGDDLDIVWDRFDLEQFRKGLDVELEHGTQDPFTDVTGDRPLITGKIALAHLNEFPDYYTRLEKMEHEAEQDLVERERGDLVPEGQKEQDEFFFG